MSGKFPLQPLLDLASERMDEASRRLGELIAMETADKNKLRMLQDYRAEYEARFLEQARNGIGPDAWRNYSAFIGRLDEAIAVQRESVQRAGRNTADGQQAWMAQRNKVKAFDTLAQRHHQTVLRQENRAEQKLSDEHAARRHGPTDQD